MTLEALVNGLHAKGSQVVHVDGPRELPVTLRWQGTLPYVLAYSPDLDAPPVGVTVPTNGPLPMHHARLARQGSILLDGLHVNAVRYVWPGTRSHEPASLTVLYGMIEA